MKTLFFSFLLLMIGYVAAAQTPVKYDNVLFTNGVEFSGKITKVTDDSITFVHKGETLEYRFPKNKIFRIEFASGRTEVLTSIESDKKNAEQVIHTARLETARPTSNDRRANTIAVLPFRFQGQNYNPEMPYTIQNEYYKQARSVGNLYEYQDPQVTNAILIRKGIDAQQLRGYTMDELCNILGVSYVVTGNVNMRSTGVNVTNTGTTTQGTTIFGKPTTITTNQTQAQENFSTLVEVNIYNDGGRLVYNRSKQSIWSTPDAYKLAIGFLVKRTPL